MINPEAVSLKPSKSAQLRRMLDSPHLEFIMEAHNGISARIVEEAGFHGIWASGLSLSAQFGVRDNNEASWTQVVEMLEFMSDVTRIPILLDGDTGYGNFNNLRRLVKKIEQRGIAGVCIEDKLFPKTNSFIAGERQNLADIDEFCGKIKAGKDSQNDGDFCVVARVEALIAGWDLREALLRAEAYRAAGADAILIHSKLSRPDQILAFAAEWAGRAPLVIVPTKYYSTPTDVYRQAGISLVIWANHMLRAAVAAMESAACAIQETETPVYVEDRIAPVEEIFRLQGADELSAAERRYAVSGRSRTHAVILAATRGEALNGLTATRPKVMLPIGGKPILRRLVEELKKQAVNEITVVAGYRAEAIDTAGISLVLNPDYQDSGELASLSRAESCFGDDTVILYGDLLFRNYILRDLLDSDAGIVAVVDSADTHASVGGASDYAYCTQPDARSLVTQEVYLTRITDDPRTDFELPSGRWIGMWRAQGEGCRALKKGLADLRARADFSRLNTPDLLNHLVSSGHKVRVLYIHGHWLDVNTLDDLDRAGSFAEGRH